MKYILLRYPRYPTINLGNDIQTIAVENLLAQLGVERSDMLFLHRDCLGDYRGEEAICVMQGWFANGHEWLPPQRIRPVFNGFHLSDKLYTFCRAKSVSASLKRHEPIGCRDKKTMQFFDSIGVAAYFSRCLTLTLPSRDKSSQAKKVFLVNVPPKLRRYIPKDIAEGAEEIDQKYVYTNDDDDAWKEYLSQARCLLARYREEAALVVTSALHCAAPCTAMGIPVVLLNPNPTHRSYLRFQAIDDIIPVYNVYDLERSRVNWSPTPPDIEDLKRDMTENLRRTCFGTFENELYDEELMDLRRRIGAKRESFGTNRPGVAVDRRWFRRGARFLRRMARSAIGNRT
ncbi:MAG: polysaccharide pyruvyl transferase family protein [Proteobacteria bacterium]|nr:MAG: polysaccharide pyruvyl transferase family protein [Pseudomonadota bacterium]